MKRKKYISLLMLIILASCHSGEISSNISSSIYSSEQTTSIISNSNVENSLSEEDKINKANYKFEESKITLRNPDQGFYHPIYVLASTSGIQYANYIINEKDQLYHLRIDISKFAKATNGEDDLEFTDEMLNGLEALLSLLTSKEKSCIVRFAYDPSFEGSANKEASISMMERHIEQVSPILNKYKNCITAIEVGMFGPWGEMHTSKIATSSNISLIIAKFLECVEELPILVRTPAMIYNYLGITINDIDNYVIDENSSAYRLGMFNDGYLGSDSDLGTYSNRKKEVAWLSKQTNHLPYGGEVTIPNSTLHDIDNCLEEMFLLNLSYLNYEWNNEVVNKWKTTYYTSTSGSDSLYYDSTAFDYINNHLGYRLTLKESSIQYNHNKEELAIDLKIDNVGFGNINKKKEMTIYLLDEENHCYRFEQGLYKNESDLSFSIKDKLTASTYKLYISLHNGLESDRSLYSIEFANDDLFNEEIRANYVGEITIE